MKKSGGSPSRVHYTESQTPVRKETPRNRERSRKWGWYLAGGGAIIILILLVRPCQLRRCGGSPERGTGSRQGWSGGPGEVAEKKRTVHTKHADLKRAAPGKKSPADAGSRKDDRYAKKERGTVSPHRPAEPDNKDRDAVKPAEKEKPVQQEKKPLDARSLIKPYQKPVIPNLGTKIEIIPAPDKQ